MTDIKHLRPTKLLWVDLEMTGLDPDTQRIIEVAAHITDFNFTQLASYEGLVYQPDTVLESATDWNKEHHGGKGGLFERVRSQGRPEKEIVSEFVQFIQKQFGDEPAVMAGSSIHQDRRFIRKWWPDVEALLHYRMMDVSSLKIIVWGKYDVRFVSKENHRATDDIDESIEELQFLLDWLQKPHQ